MSNRAQRRQRAAQVRKGGAAQVPRPGFDPERSVYVAVASYDGKLDTHLCGRLLGEQVILAMHGYGMGFDAVNGNALVPVARNLLVHQFLQDYFEAPDGTRHPYANLLFIDADVTPEPGALLHILQHDVDVVFGVPRHKTETAESYPVEFVRDAQGRAGTDPETGLIEATFGPAGFLRIRRGVLERMVAAGQAPEVVEKDWQGQVVRRYRAFFSVGQQGTSYIGEDVWFLNNARNAGVRCWCDPGLGFEHSGTKRWKGHVGHFLRARQAEVDMEADAQRRMADAREAGPAAAAAD